MKYGDRKNPNPNSVNNAPRTTSLCGPYVWNCKLARLTSNFCQSSIAASSVNREVYGADHECYLLHTLSYLQAGSWALHGAVWVHECHPCPTLSCLQAGRWINDWNCLGWLLGSPKLLISTAKTKVSLSHRVARTSEFVRSASDLQRSVPMSKVVRDDRGNSRFRQSGMCPMRFQWEISLWVANALQL